MKQLNTERFNVAWFKLAEFVTRGEKERALGMLKLLMHSVDDHALAHQLEGDIFLSFEDPKALESYTKAAQMYARNSDTKKAIALYEQLITLNPHDEESLATLLELYDQLSGPSLIALKVNRLIPVLIQTGHVAQAHEQLERIRQQCPEESYIKLRKRLYHNQEE